MKMYWDRGSWDLVPEEETFYVNPLDGEVFANVVNLSSPYQSPAPDALWTLVACSCKKSCTGNCGCRRVGFFCSKLCESCEGNCSNADPNFIDDKVDDVPLAEEAKQIRLEEKEPSGSSQKDISEHPPEMQPTTSEDPQPGPSGIKAREKEGDDVEEKGERRRERS
ncbi:hypothetical protein JTB14_010977 [Gonioctena quinquepunctata]|nr:hypothetical protein JTB14_010977 [Gonioctena quinquepunctata]